MPEFPEGEMIDVTPGTSRAMTTYKPPRQEIYIPKDAYGNGLGTLGKMVTVGGMAVGIIVIGGGVLVLVNAATGVVIAVGVSAGVFASSLTFLSHQVNRVLQGGSEGSPSFSLRSGNSTSTRTSTDNRQYHDNRRHDDHRQTGHNPKAQSGFLGRSEAVGHKEVHHHESGWRYVMGTVGLLLLAGFAAAGNMNSSETRVSISPVQPVSSPPAAGPARFSPIPERKPVCVKPVGVTSANTQVLRAYRRQMLITEHFWVKRIGQLQWLLSFPTVEFVRGDFPSCQELTDPFIIKDRLQERS